MGRPQKFESEAILDAALDEGLHAGFERLSASRVAKRLGAPSGSLYHRYASRDSLVADLWLRTVSRFQAGYVEILKSDRPPGDRARDAARYVVDWTCDNRREAELLLRYRREDLLKGDMPADVAQRAASLNKPAARVLADFARELSPSAPNIERVRFACVTIPMAAARESLSTGKPPSAESVALIDEVVCALLNVGGDQ